MSWNIMLFILKKINLKEFKTYTKYRHFVGIVFENFIRILIILKLFFEIENYTKFTVNFNTFAATFT